MHLLLNNTLCIDVFLLVCVGHGPEQDCQYINILIKNILVSQ